MSRLSSAGVGDVKPCGVAIADLLPHKPPMVLLDQVLGYDATTLCAAYTITQASLFMEAEGVPVHVGLEYMAQSCAAWAGAIACEAGKPISIGFLVGTRQFRAYVSHFRVGDRLAITATQIYRDEQMGSFDCRIEIDGALAAEARLNVYQPSVEEIAARNLRDQ